MKSGIYTAKVEPVRARISHLGFMRDARHFYEAEGKLTGTGDFNVVKYFLLARSVELCLKSLLLDYGFTIKELRAKKKYGHNLSKLIKRVSEKKILSVSSKEKATVEQISDLYDGKKFEYFSVSHAMTGYKDFPELIILKQVALSILEKAEEMLRKEKNPSS